MPEIVRPACGGLARRMATQVPLAQSQSRTCGNVPSCAAASAASAGCRRAYATLCRLPWCWCDPLRCDVCTCAVASTLPSFDIFIVLIGPVCPGEDSLEQFRPAAQLFQPVLNRTEWF